MNDLYFRKGFGLKHEVADSLGDDYHSSIVDRLREHDSSTTAGGLTIRLAKEFGFCYGVDRAVEYAYQSREKFPDKRIFLVGEIIHNPHVNEKMERMGIKIIQPGSDGIFDFSHIQADDVVLMPAFGVRVEDFRTLRDIECVLVDTTCGSVLNVWKRVERYAKDGVTAVVHGKHYHEETKATVSQATKYENGHYLIVRSLEEADLLCDYLRGNIAVDEISKTFGHKVSVGFDFVKHLVRVGVANQTTMLASESMEMARRIGEAMKDRYGEEQLDYHFRNFDTICSATQERQDAVLELIEEPLDVMIVVGGYNSSNTNHLTKICSERVKTFHIADAECIDPETGVIRHKPVDTDGEVSVAGWMDGAARIGITAGASTPNNKIGEAIERMLQTRGIDATV